MGTGPQLDKLWIGILNLRPEEESEKLKEILAVGLSEIDPAKLSQKADGDFRVDPKDAESGIIPGVLEKALGRQVNRLAKELSESSDPDQAERLLSDAVLRCEVSADKWPFEDAALRIAGINFWDRDKNPDKVNQVLLHEVLREKE